MSEYEGVWEWMAHLKREINRAFTPPCRMSPEEYSRFKRNAWDQTTLMREELVRLYKIIPLPPIILPAKKQKEM